MNRLVLPRKRVKRGDPAYKHYQYFYQGTTAGEIKIPRNSRRSYIKDLEAKLFRKLVGCANEHS